MQELIRNASGGWLRYTEAGKYAVLVLGLLLWTWYLGKEGGKNKCEKEKYEKEKREKLLPDSGSVFWRYTAITAALAICPLTAALWMTYQTRFYDYEWIWSVVPVTGFIAAAGGSLYLAYFRQQKKSAWWKKCGLILCGLAVVYLCGSMGTDREQGMWSVHGEAASEETVLTLLTTAENASELCVWAPAEVLQGIRERDGRICLLYGRNMWEDALNAYSYDTYEEEIVALYEWMEELTIVPDEGVALPELDEKTALAYMETAFLHGVNCIVLPKLRASAASIVELAAAEKGMVVTLQQTSGYTVCFIAVQ